MPKYEVVNLPSNYEVVDLPSASPAGSGPTLDLTKPNPGEKLVPPQSPLNRPRDYQMTTGGGRLGALVDAVTPNLHPTPATPEAMIDALPAAGAVAGGAIGGMPGAALGGAGGEAYRQLVRRAVGLEAPDSSWDATKGIVKQGAIGAATELPGAAARVLTSPFKAANVAKAADFLSQSTKGGLKLQNEVRQRIIEANAAKTELANKTASELTNTFRPAADPAFAATEGAKSLQQGFRDVFLPREQEVWGDVTGALAGKKADIRPIATQLLKLEDEAAKTRATAGLKSLTSEDPDWVQLVNDMRAANKATVTPGKMVTQSESRLNPNTMKMETTESPIAQEVGIKSAPNMAETASALPRARATVSKRIYDLENDSSLPRTVVGPYLDGLKALRGSLDDKMASMLADNPSGAGLLHAAKSYSASGREIMNQTLYKMAATRPQDLTKALLDNRNPGLVDQFYSMAEKTGMQDAVADVQRNALDTLLTTRRGADVLPDVASFESRFNATGLSGQKLLMKNPESRQTVQALIEQSRAARDLQKVPDLKGLGEEGKMAELMLSGVANKAGGGYGAIVGVMGYLKDKGTYTLAKIASNKAANRSFVTAMERYAAAGRATGEVATGMARALRMAGVANELQIAATQQPQFPPQQ